jgi:hypothetical protein
MEQCIESTRKPEEPKLEKPTSEGARDEEIPKKEDAPEEVLRDEAKPVPSPKQEVHFWPEASKHHGSNQILSFPKKATLSVTCHACG